MNIEWWSGYLLTTFILSLSPGSGAVNTMTTAISYDYRSVMASIAGLQSGLAIQIVVVGIGLGTLFAHSELAFILLKWFGAGWLCWLGIQQWRAARGINLHSLAVQQSLRHLYTRALLVNISNPKSLVFLAALFPQFLLPVQPQATQYLVLGVTSVLVDIVVMSGYASLASRLALWLKSARQMKILNRIFGSLFIVIALLLANAHLQ